jgi:hypothetical protein
VARAFGEFTKCCLLGVEGGGAAAHVAVSLLAALRVGIRAFWSATAPRYMRKLLPNPTTGNVRLINDMSTLASHTQFQMQRFQQLNRSNGRCLWVVLVVIKRQVRSRVLRVSIGYLQ